MGHSSMKHSGRGWKPARGPRPFIQKFDEHGRSLVKGGKGVIDVKFLSPQETAGNKVSGGAKTSVKNIWYGIRNFLRETIGIPSKTSMEEHALEHGRPDPSDAKAVEKYRRGSVERANKVRRGTTIAAAALAGILGVFGIKMAADDSARQWESPRTKEAIKRVMEAEDRAGKAWRALYADIEAGLHRDISREEVNRVRRDVGDKNFEALGQRASLYELGGGMSAGNAWEKAKRDFDVK